MKKLTILAIFAASLAASSQLAAQAPAPKGASELEQAKAKLREGKPAEALALVDPIVARAEAKEAKDPEAMCPSAAAAFLVAYMRQSSKLNISVSVENDWCDAMLVQGYALGEQKRFSEAADRLGKLVKHDKFNANYLAEYAFALRSSGQVDLAMEFYRKTKDAASHYSDKAAQRHWRAVALRGIGFIEFDRANWKAAEKAYKDSLKDEPGNQIALGELELIKQKTSN